MGMTIDDAIKRYEGNSEYERTHGNLQGCLEFRQLVGWLRKYQKITEIYSDYLKYMNPDNLADRIGEVLEKGATE